MTKFILDMAISIDGYISGPGDADVGLYDWYFDPVGSNRDVVDELVAETRGHHHGSQRLRLRSRRHRI